MEKKESGTADLESNENPVQYPHIESIKINLFIKYL